MTTDEFLSQLPPHKAALHLTHNGHKSNYMTVQEDHETSEGFADWISDEERERAYATDEQWVLQWYPDTPVGFHALRACSLAALLDHVARP